MTRPVRVLMIAPGPPIVGGHGVQADYILDGLADDPGFELAFLPMNPRLPKPLAWLQRIKLVKTLVTLAAFVLKLAWKAPGRDLIHVFAAANYSFLFAPAPAILLGRLLGKPVICNYHDGRAEQHLAGWPLSRRVLGWATRIVTPSDYLVDVFAKFGFEVQAIYNVVDASAFRYRERSKPRPRLHHNRAFEALYNVPCTLRAFGIVQQRYPEAELALTHDGPLRGELQQLAKELALRNIEFRGKVTQEQTPEILDWADVYLTSSNVDNMPVSILECYAAGLPVAATAAGGIPYMVEDGRTGLLVELNDHEALAAAALRILEEDGLAVKLARAGRDELAKYDWEKGVGPKWKALYRELAAR